MSCEQLFEQLILVAVHIFCLSLRIPLPIHSSCVTFHITKWIIDARHCLYNTQEIRNVLYLRTHYMFLLTDKFLFFFFKFHWRTSNNDGDNNEQERLGGIVNGHRIRNLFSQNRFYENGKRPFDKNGPDWQDIVWTRTKLENGIILNT